MSNKWLQAFSLFRKQNQARGKNKVLFIGEDFKGNKYYEEERPNAHRVNHRYYMRDDVNESTHLADLAHVPPAWDAWLRYRRTQPPSAEEVRESEEYFKAQQAMAAAKKSQVDLKENHDKAGIGSERKNIGLLKPDDRSRPRSGAFPKLPLNH